MLKHMPVKWKLSEVLTNNKLSVRQVMLETGLSSNTLYPIARGTSEQVSLETIAKIIEALRALTGKKIEVSDLLEFKYKHILEMTPEEMERNSAVLVGLPLELLQKGMEVIKHGSDSIKQRWEREELSTEEAYQLVQAAKTQRGN
jgi:DNA-binding Xre family transcriptional regulator